ncbi:MAG: hypothetical protein QW320_11155, partial [Ignisphaera sp.]
QPVEEKPVVDLVEELEKLRGEGLITAEEAEWLKAVYEEFGLLPYDALRFLRSKSLQERIEILGKARLDITRVRESWLLEQAPKREGVENEREGELKPPASFVARYLAEKAIELGLVEPVIVQLGSELEYALKVGKWLYSENELKMVARALAKSAEPHYVIRQIYPMLLEEIQGRARGLPRERINPEHLLNLENGVLDLEWLTFTQIDDVVFTYELPAVDPLFLQRLKRGEVTEEYFAMQAFYQVIRKHYAKEEWEKLKYVLGATITLRTLKLIAIIVGERNTRKSFLNGLLRSALRKLVEPMSLRQVLNENNRFSLSHAIFARTLVAAEAARTIIECAETLKRLTGGDPIVIDRKFRNPVIREEDYKVIIFSNELPRFKRVDDALLDRIVIIQTENPRRPDAEELALEERARKNLGAFMEFILWCYWQLRGNNFSVPTKGDPIYAKMLHEALSNVTLFLRELESGLELNGRKYSVFFTAGARTEAAQLYDIYLEWCHSRKESPEGRNNFYQYVGEVWAKHGVIKLRGERGIEFRGLHIVEKSMADGEL